MTSKLRHFCLVVILFLLSVILVASNCTPASSNRVKVVTSTSLLAYIAEQVGGDKVKVTNLIPPVQHPGNFNIRPGDIETLAAGKLFLIHGWPGEGYVEKLVASANNPDLTVYKASVNGNWMMPPVQSEATGKVAIALIEVDGQNAASYKNNSEKYRQKIAAKETEIKIKLTKADIEKVKVIASARQADFLGWAGFKVVATYAGPNTLNPQVVKDLVDKGKQEKVILVIDNLQDGKDAGKGIAEELGAIQLNLSNFPGGFENTNTWEKAIDYNITLLLEALTRRK